MGSRKVIYLIISLIFLLTLACRVGEQVLSFLPAEPTPINLATRFGTTVVGPTAITIAVPTHTLLPTVTSTATLRPPPTPTRTPTKRPTSRPPTVTPIPPAKTLSPWPFQLAQNTEEDGQGTFQIRVKVTDGNGMLKQGRTFYKGRTL